MLSEMCNGLILTPRLENNTITVQVLFTCVLRNKIIVSKGQDILREAPFTVQEPLLVSATT